MTFEGKGAFWAPAGPADKLEAFRQLIERYRDARHECGAYVERMRSLSTTPTVEADRDHMALLELKADDAARMVAAQALVVLADGLLERCAEIIEIETAGRP